VVNDLPVARDASHDLAVQSNRNFLSRGVSEAASNVPATIQIPSILGCHFQILVIDKERIPMRGDHTSAHFLLTPRSFGVGTPFKRHGSFAGPLGG
jgi:hypothetical protein